MNFSKLNNLTGWSVFIIALITYTLTVEPTASFWDCGEFIACAYKLEVPHPPGAPLFLLLGRAFSLLAFGNTEMVAFWINMLSVVASAFTILFLFWTITLIGRKAIKKEEKDYSQADSIGLLLAGTVGSLIYTFSDTFWFSAVEAEVYGLSSFFTAIVVWAAFKWERIQDEIEANRWIILIAYLIGLSIGIHLLNLVTLPALALLYYFKKKEKPTLTGSFFAMFIGLVILGIINSLIITGLPSIALTFELFMVNTLGLPYNSGAIFFLIVLIGTIIYFIQYSYKKNKVNLNIALFSLIFILIGYSSYTLVLVRSAYNPPLNENDPSNILNYLKYLKREQYGNRSLLYGPVYTSEVDNIEKGDPVYKKSNGRYEVYTHKPKVTYSQEILFPRVYSTSGNHPQLYMEKLGLAPGEKPTFADNVRFFFNYQVGHMYMRYLMWNFVGRESDLQDAGTINPFESTQDLPYSLKHNKARNNYFFLPLILVFIGFYFLYAKNDKDFFITILLFILPGIALAVYINSPPQEPRERDYIFVGSFHFMAIWAGLAVMQLSAWLEKFLHSHTLRYGLVGIFTLAAPLIMAQQNWDDHDRSSRVHQIDFAKNLLDSCAPNAILFTGGDNDTFPLWYLQEVEGYRTDVRVCNLSLLGTDWYVDQMRRDTYLSKSLPIKFNKEQFIEGINDQLIYNEQENIKVMSLPQYMDLLHRDDPRLKAQTTTGDLVNTLPCDSLSIPVNIEKVSQYDWVPNVLVPFMSDQISWKLPTRSIYKDKIIQLDIISNNALNDWERPIYFSSTLPNDQYLGLKECMALEGYALRLMPFKIPGADDGWVNADIAKENFMNKFKWTGLNDPSIYYHGEFYKGIPLVSARLNVYRVAEQLVRENRNQEAIELMDYINQVIPDEVMVYDQFSAYMATMYISAGAPEKGLKIANTMADRINKDLDYFAKNREGHNMEIQLAFYELQIFVNAFQNTLPKEAKRFEDIYVTQYAKF